MVVELGESSGETLASGELTALEYAATTTMAGLATRARVECRKVLLEYHMGSAWFAEE